MAPGLVIAVEDMRGVRMTELVVGGRHQPQPRAAGSLVWSKVRRVHRCCVDTVSTYRPEKV